MSAITEVRLQRAAQAIRAAAGATDVLVYGSAAGGRLRADSDVDLAFVAPEPPSPETRLALISELVRVLGRSADLVWLPSASPVLAAQILRHGRLLTGAPSGALARLTMTTVSAYEDLKRVRGPAEEALRRRFGHA